MSSIPDPDLYARFYYWRYDNLIGLIASGHASPAIPYWPVFAALAQEKIGDKLRYHPSLELTKCWTYNIDFKMTKDLRSRYAQVACMLVQRIRTERNDRRKLSPVIPLETRLVNKFYLPFLEPIRDAVLGRDTRTSVVLKRGEPGIAYEKIKETDWTFMAFVITFSKGWAFSREPKFFRLPDQKNDSLFITCEPVPLQLDFNDKKNTDLEQIKTIKFSTIKRRLDNKKDYVVGYGAIYDNIGRFTDDPAKLLNCARATRNLLVKHAKIRLTT